MSGPRAIVVGAGGISNAWFRPLKKETVEVAAVVDLRKEAAEKKIAEHGLSCPASDDLGKTLAGVEADFLVDLTVPGSHCEVTCAGLEAGLNVVSEKPMASSMDEGRKMVATSEKTGRMYMVSQSRRWDARHATLARTVAEGRLGVLTTLGCDFFLGAHFGGFRAEMESPLILDMAIHHFDLARMISGADPVAVYAEEFNPVGSWYRGDVAANCLFEMTGGVRFSYRGSWCAEGCHTSWDGDWRVIGEKGTMLYEKDQPPHGQVLAYDRDARGPSGLASLKHRERGASANDAVAKGGLTRPLEDLGVAEVEVEYGGMHGSLREMLRFLQTGEAPQTECHDNIKSLAMVLGAIESSRKGERIRIEV